MEKKEVVINDIVYIEKTFKNGAVVRYIKPSEDYIPEPIELMPTLEDMQMQTLLNTEYLVILSEISNL